MKDIKLKVIIEKQSFPSPPGRQRHRLLPWWSNDLMFWPSMAENHCLVVVLLSSRDEDDHDDFVCPLFHMAPVSEILFHIGITQQE